MFLLCLLHVLCNLISDQSHHISSMFLLQLTLLRDYFMCKAGIFLLAITTRVFAKITQSDTNRRSTKCVIIRSNGNHIFCIVQSDVNEKSNVSTCFWIYFECISYNFITAYTCTFWINVFFQLKIHFTFTFSTYL